MSLLNVQNLTADEALANLEPYDNVDTNSTSHLFLDILDGFTLKGIFHLDGAVGDKVIRSISSGGGVQSKRYRALITQIGLDNPVAVILENTLGGVPQFLRTQKGDYRLMLLGAFTVGKTTILIGPPSFNGAAIIKAVFSGSFFGDDGVLFFSSIDLEQVGNPGVDDAFTDVLFDITVNS